MITNFMDMHFFVETPKNSTCLNHRDALKSWDIKEFISNIFKKVIGKILFSKVLQ